MCERERERERGEKNERERERERERRRRNRQRAYHIHTSSTVRGAVANVSAHDCLAILIRRIPHDIQLLTMPGRPAAGAAAAAAVADDDGDDGEEEEEGKAGSVNDDDVVNAVSVGSGGRSSVVNFGFTGLTGISRPNSISVW